ncbi:hypothetical protein [Candidatus Poriferisodalis sp.]|uniref:hypothetical protein n=1 Tax=Candidatus Poriferisodalis sp. TaxID=3101277 RepID=UPI003B01A706
MTVHQMRAKAFGLSAALVLIAVACGGGGADPASGDQAPAASGAQESAVIRLAMPSEPLWQWIIDSGSLEQWEARHGARIEISHPFRPFTALVSGHADVILVDALSIPALTRGLEHQPVIIGKYAADRSVAAVWRTSQAENLAGVMEGTVAADSEFGTTLLWALIVDDKHDGLEFSDDSQDFELLTAALDLGDVVKRGDADACICLPDRNAEYLSAGMLRPLYEGAPAGELYASMIGDGDRLPLGEVFVADGAWHAENAATARAFLDLWEQAIRHWHAHAGEIIALYPELLSVQSDAAIEWLTEHVETHDWIVDSVYLADADADAYADAVERLAERGFIEADAPVPAVVIQPSSSTLGGQ